MSKEKDRSRLLAHNAGKDIPAISNLEAEGLGKRREVLYHRCEIGP